MPTWFPAVASVFLALIPVFIWIDLIQKEGEDKSLYIKTFLAGTLAVVPPFLLIFLFDAFPDLNIYSLIHRTIGAVALAALLINIIVGIIEEIAKNMIVRVIDRKHPEYIQTIGSALKLSICAGLGFAFAENIFYFYNVWTNPAFGAADLFATFVFRSMFTMLGHMVFSGVFGYYFGIGKFAADITEQSRWQGSEHRFARFIATKFGKMTFEVVREFKNLQGLSLAIFMHMSFNLSLDLEHKLPSILIVALGALYIVHLLQTKSGHLLFSVTKRRASSMAARDEDVVLELLGMWTKEGKYGEVIEICDRLLSRDPDNNVVKLFRAKAWDNTELRHFYEALKGIFKKNTAGITAEQQTAPNLASLQATDEKIILEVMNLWYKEGQYGQVLDVAKRLLARNPQSQGAKILLEKAVDHQKLKHVFDSLAQLFQD